MCTSGGMCLVNFFMFPEGAASCLPHLEVSGNFFHVFTVAAFIFVPVVVCPTVSGVDWQRASKPHQLQMYSAGVSYIANRKSFHNPYDLPIRCNQNLNSR